MKKAPPLPPPMDDEIWTVPEVARFLKVSQRSIYTLIQYHDLPSFKAGGSVRFSRHAVQRWIEQRMRGL